MKRDMELIRELLLYSEENAQELISILDPSDFPNRDQDLVNYHLTLLEQAGYLNKGRGAIGRRGLGTLTMSGHDFLDSIRDPEIWRNTKTVGEKAGGWTLEILSEIAKGLIMTKIKQHTGVDLES